MYFTRNIIDIYNYIILLCVSINMSVRVCAWVCIFTNKYSVYYKFIYLKTQKQKLLYFK